MAAQPTGAARRTAAADRVAAPGGAPGRSRPRGAVAGGGAVRITRQGALLIT